MAEKKPFVLRIDPELLKAVEKWAADEFRSINGQLEYIINAALRKEGRIPSGNNGNKEKIEKKVSKSHIFNEIEKTMNICSSVVTLDF